MRKKSGLSAMKLSIILPVWNEAQILASTLAALPEDAETVVVDGGSTDGTRAVASSAGALVAGSERGRSRQMNLGAKVSRGDVLLFLHADGILGPGAYRAIGEALSSPEVVGGSFRLRIGGGRRSLAVVALGSNARARYLGMPYGDQALFLRRSAFESVGGFPDVPFLEDVELVRRLRRLGRLVQVDETVTTGSRHWEPLGALGTTLLNWSMVALYLMGVSPSRLAPVYRRCRSGGESAGPARADEPDEPNQPIEPVRP
jgi:rSAM/selenodomain-associated transferase 2